MSNLHVNQIKEILKSLNVNEENSEKIVYATFQDETSVFGYETIFFYNFCGFIKHYGIEKCLNYIDYLCTLETWDDKLKLTDPFKTLNDINKINIEMIKYNQMPSLKGIFKCKHCGSDNVRVSKKITRADEAAIVSRWCQNCNNRT